MTRDLSGAGKRQGLQGPPLMRGRAFPAFRLGAGAGAQGRLRCPGQHPQGTAGGGGKDGERNGPGDGANIPKRVWINHMQTTETRPCTETTS